MRYLTLTTVALALVALAAPGAAQEETDSTTGWELGVLFGLHHYRVGEDDVTTFQIPSAPLYASIHLDDRFGVGAELTLSYTDNRYYNDFGVYGIRFFRGNSSEPYALALAAGTFSSATDPRLSLAGGLGALMRLGPAFVLRGEARYRRWFDADYARFEPWNDPGEQSGFNDFMILVGIGTRFGDP